MAAITRIPVLQEIVDLEKERETLTRRLAEIDARLVKYRRMLPPRTPLQIGNPRGTPLLICLRDIVVAEEERGKAAARIVRINERLRVLRKPFPRKPGKK